MFHLRGCKILFCIVVESDRLIKILVPELIGQIFAASNVPFHCSERHRKCLHFFRNVFERRSILLNCLKTDILVPHPGRYIFDCFCILPDGCKADLRSLFFDESESSPIFFDRLKAEFRSLFFDICESIPILFDCFKTDFRGLTVYIFESA